MERIDTDFRQGKSHAAMSAAREADKTPPPGLSVEVSKTTSVVNSTVISAPNGTTFWYATTDGRGGYDNISGPYLYGVDPGTSAGDKSVYSAIGKKVVRRILRKKRGDTSSANDRSRRLRVLTPVVMYQFVKDRFRIIERHKLSSRLDKLAKLMENARVLGQIAMADQIGERFGQLIREQELLVCGYTEYLPKKLLDKFIDLTTNKVIKLTPLKNYIRPMPKKVQRVLDDVQKRKLFDSYVVMHTDVNNTAVAKTKEEKRDPILFGTIADAPDNYYHIISWTDDLCDLTFDQIIDKLSLEDEQFEIEQDVNQALLNTIL